MSYCVNCGVELQKSEPRCPLCGTEVLNPNELHEEQAIAALRAGSPAGDAWGVKPIQEYFPNLGKT